MAAVDLPFVGLSRHNKEADGSVDHTYELRQRHLRVAMALRQRCLADVRERLDLQQENFSRLQVGHKGTRENATL